MTYKIKHSKKVINMYKFKRISDNTKTMICNVYLTKDDECFGGTGLYLSGWVYFVNASGYYAYKVKDVGVHKDNLAFQLLHLANPF